MDQEVKSSALELGLLSQKQKTNKNNLGYPDLPLKSYETLNKS